MNVLALCAGVGGLELGLRLAVPEARTVCYVEGEAYAAAQIVHLMAQEALDPAPVWSDLRTFDARPWRGIVGCVSGGYPCQPFSVAGKRRGADDPRHLWPHVARVVGECRPAVCFFENVGNHLRMGFREVHDDLRAMGYRVAAGLFTAEEVGAPHKRERLFILGYAEGQRRGEGWPEPKFRGGWQATAQPGGALARQQREGLEGRPVFGGDGEPEQPATERVCGERVDKERPLPDAISQCVQQQSGWGGREGGAEAAWLARVRPTWPPAPDDLDAWLSALLHQPELEPAVCRMADGMAHRVDRLRACGNGVVPLVAAYAFRTLWTAFKEQ